MNRIIATTLAISVGAAAAYASDYSTAPDLNDATSQSITQMLLNNGYQVQSLEAEEDGYEAYALKDGTLWEIEMDANLAILEIERDDDDESDDD